MNRRHSAFLRSLAAAADPVVGSMSYHRPYFREVDRRGGRRFFSDDASESVSGDSHFRASRVPNSGFRPGFYASPQTPPIYEGRQPGSSQEPRQWVRPCYNNRSQFPAQQRQPPPKRRSFKPSDYREWDFAKPGPHSDYERFTVLSYNILADYLASDHRQNLYFHIPQDIMDWSWRKRSIIFEIGLWSADVLCFQEVDRFQDLLDELVPHGYTGIWKMRTGNAVDGCAIFWRSSRFKLVYEESIEYNKLGLRDNVAQICVLQSLPRERTGNVASSSSTSSEGSNRVVVCNIHVLFNPKRGEIKLGQIRVLLTRAHAVSRLWDDAPVVVCGDFNSTPMSPIYDFITKQKLDLSELSRDIVSGQVAAENYRFPRGPYPSSGARDAANISGTSVNNFEIAEVTESLDASAAHECSTSIYLSDLNEKDKVENLACDSLSYESTRVDLLIAEKSSEGNELVDCLTDRLHKDNGSFTSGLFSSSSNQRLNSNGDEVLTENCEMLNGPFSRTKWTPAEVEAATGNADSKVVEHPLKLASAYSTVKDSLGIRDSSGEPLVTSYHRRFCGTVDYIWFCDGLRPVKVLAPIPKHVMLQTRGFPTRKWGSDHIALVTELAFIRDPSSENSPK